MRGGARIGAEQRWDALRAVLATRHADPPLVRVARLEGQELRASFAQERLWFLDRLQPNSTAYNLAVTCRLRGALDVAALERSLGELLSRHEILRTTLRFADGNLWQRIALPSPMTLRREEVPEVDIERWADDEADQPFDIERGPLWRAALARVNAHDHCLLLMMHHAIFDAWSFELFMRELCTVYGAYRLGHPSPLGAPTLQYADFASWQRLRDDAAGEERLDYWRDRLGGALPVLHLPTDHPRGAGMNRRGASQTVILPRSLADALEALAIHEGATLNMLLLAAFKALLHRYTGDDDVIVGAPVANRNRAGLDQMLGLFTNTLPLRTALTGEPTCRELLARVRDTVTGALAHQDVPFDKVVKAARSGRDATLPLFRVMFAFQNVPQSGWSWPELDATAKNLPSGRAKLDLVLTMENRPGESTGLSGLLEYDADLFESSTISRLLGHLVTLLGGVVAQPDQRISDLPLLEAWERHQVVTGWNDTVVAFPDDDRGIHRIFEAQVQRAPQASALVGDTETLSYDSLNRRANRLARCLVDQNLGPGSSCPGRARLIAICLERSPALVVAQLAILKAGAAYVPVSPSTPRAFVAQLLKHVTAVVTDAASGALLSGLGTPTVDVHDAGSRDQHDHNLSGSCAPDDLAYVMFTSGSTGPPRGVCIPHRGVARLVRGTAYTRFTTDEVFLQLAAPAFDAATFEIWGALLNGATLIVPPGRRLSLSEMGTLIARHRVTTLWLTSGLFERFVDGGVEKLAGLRQLLSGGDVMSVSHAERFLRQAGGCRLLNCYGPTENTTFTSTHVVEEIEPGRSIPIGRPIANSQVYLLDDRLRPVPIGVTGEAYLGGAGLAKGYLDDEQATGERFVASPFRPGDTLYKTGDLMRWRADGTLDFIGRTDHQLKLRGFRVEPAEVERMLVECPEVKAAAVRAVAGEAGDKRLVAYVVPRRTEKGDELPVRLRQFLRSRLPAHVVPADVVVLSELPLTENGKRARGLLPAPPPSRHTMRAFAPPRDAMERRLATFFQQTIGIDSVGIHDDFFELGGDSLSALAVGAAIERAMGREFPLVTLFDKPTIAQLADELRDFPAGRPVVLPDPLDQGVVAIKKGAISPEGATRSALIPPLFLVAGGHGGRAELLVCAKLVSRLRDGETVYGLLAPPNRDTVEDIAAAHVTSMRRLQPRGPYRIGGECIGGVVAYEIAQQLRAAGEELALLLLLDTWCPTTAGVIHHRLVGQPLALMKAGVSFLATLPGRDRAAEPWPLELLRRAVAPAAAKRHMRACMRYRPIEYPGRVTVLASADNLRRGLADAWRELAVGGVGVHEAPGNHESYAKEYFRQTAERLRICVEGPIADGSNERRA